MKTGFAGGKRMLLISTDNMTNRLEQQKKALKVAVAAGVKHVIYTSVQTPPKGCKGFPGDHFDMEKAIAETKGITWTILGNGMYVENLCMTLPRVMAKGEWHTASGDGKTSYISKDDCAHAAAAALSSKSNTNKKFEVTGGAALTVDQVAQEVTKCCGNAVKVIQGTPENLTKILTEGGMPAQFVQLMVAFEVNTKAGNFSQVGGGFKELTGKNPKSFHEAMEGMKAAMGGKCPAGGQQCAAGGQQCAAGGQQCATKPSK